MDRRRLATKIGFGHFMATAGHHELLEHEEEVHLAKLMVAGDEAERLLEAEHRPYAVRRLRSIRRAGAHARDELIRHNIRLAINVARKSRVSSARSLTLEDVVSEGVRGLVYATKKFDPTRGYRFTTYASWWVRQSVGRALDDTDDLIRVPVYLRPKVAELKKARWLLDESGVPDDFEMLLEVTGFGEEELRRTLDAERVLAPVSLDRPVGGDSGDATLGDFVVAEDADVFEAVVDGLGLSEVMLAVSRLDEREQTVIEMRFGLLGDEPQTLEKLGELFGVSRERIRQIEKVALQNLRHHLRKGSRAVMI